MRMSASCTRPVPPSARVSDNLPSPQASFLGTRSSAVKFPNDRRARHAKQPMTATFFDKISPAKSTRHTFSCTHARTHKTNQLPRTNTTLREWVRQQAGLLILAACLPPQYDLELARCSLLAADQHPLLHAGQGNVRPSRPPLPTASGGAMARRHFAHHMPPFRP